jgi:hypothetical protein
MNTNNRAVFAIAAAATVLTLAACGGTANTASTSGSPSATALEHKIPGCGQITVNPSPQVGDVQDVTCVLANGTQVDLATFAAQAAELAWIQNGGEGSPPDPSFAGCCIEGNLWAATGSWIGNDGDQVFFQPVIAAIGGKQVSG